MDNKNTILNQTIFKLGSATAAVGIMLVFLFVAFSTSRQPLSTIELSFVCAGIAYVAGATLWTCSLSTIYWVKEIFSSHKAKNFAKTITALIFALALVTFLGLTLVGIFNGIILVWIVMVFTDQLLVALPMLMTIIGGLTAGAAVARFYF